MTPASPHKGQRLSQSSLTAPSPPSSSLSNFTLRGASPALSTTSSSSVAATTGKPLLAGTVPSLALSASSKKTGIPINTPPETPRASSNINAAGSGTGVKREANSEPKTETGKSKKRRIAPTLVQEFAKPEQPPSESKGQ